MRFSAKKSTQKKHHYWLLVSFGGKILPNFLVQRRNIIETLPSAMHAIRASMLTGGMSLGYLAGIKYNSVVGTIISSGVGIGRKVSLGLGWREEGFETGGRMT